MKTGMIRNVGISVLAIVLGTVGWAQDQGTDNGREFHWTGKLSPDQVVVIKDINGDIDATGSSNSDQVEVSAIKSGEGAQDIKIQVVKLGDGVIISFALPVAKPGQKTHRGYDYTDSHAKLCLFFHGGTPAVAAISLGP